MRRYPVFSFLVLAAVSISHLGCPSDAPPTAGFSASVQQGQAQLTVGFVDESVPGVSPIESWMWHFGDGARSTEQNPTHTYRFGGTYTVALTVTSSVGSGSLVKTDYIVIEPGVPPTAAFTADAVRGTVPFTVDFTDESEPGSSTIELRRWDYGDGNVVITSGMASQNRYFIAGTYSVRLTVRSAVGSDSLVRTDYIVVLDPPLPPTAGFSADVVEHDRPLRAQFRDESDPGTSPIVSWLWDFGDGTASTEQNPLHYFVLEGTYSVALAITSAHGSDVLLKSDYIAAAACLNPEDCRFNPCRCSFRCFPDQEYLRGVWDIRIEFDAPVEVTHPSGEAEVLEVLEGGTMYFYPSTCRTINDFMSIRNDILWIYEDLQLVTVTSARDETLEFFTSLDDEDGRGGTLRASLTSNETKTRYSGEFSITFSPIFSPVEGEVRVVTGTMSLALTKFDCADSEGASPLVESLDPTFVSILDGPSEPITLVGQNLAEVEVITFDGYPGDIVSVTADTIVVRPPGFAHLVIQGFVEVELRTSDCFIRLPDAFEYVDVPFIDDFSPKSGTAAGEDTIMVDGFMLRHVDSVTVAGVEASFAMDEEGAELTVVTSPAPPGTSPGPIRVDTVGGFAISEDVFTYVDLISN